MVLEMADKVTVQSAFEKIPSIQVYILISKQNTMWGNRIWIGEK